MGSLFGTNGVRGIVNEDITADVALKIGKAIGKYFKGKIALASDTRITSDMLKNAVSAGLMAAGCSVIDAGVVPIPALQYYVREHDFIAGGVMITASHNPPEYNGVKCIFSDGTELGRAAEYKIEEYYESEIQCESVNKIGDLICVEDVAESYINSIVEKVDVASIKRANLKVLIDCANGTTSYTTPRLLDRLGVTTVTLNADPQGDFIRHPNEPTEDNLSDIIKMMKVTEFDLGIAHDLDGDRVVFISNKGQYISGDVSLAILAGYVLKSHKGKVVTPVSTSMTVETVVKENGGEIVYTEVGSPIVTKTMKEVGAVFGGEENGGLIFPEHQWCRDPGMAIARVLECIVSNGPIQDQVDKVPKYHVDKRDIDCPEEKKQRLYNHFKEICSDGNLDETDGLKIIFEDGWVLLRPSGTESKFRIFSESNDIGIAKTRADEFEADAQEFLLSI